MVSTVARHRDSPKDDDAQEQTAEVVGVGNRPGDAVAQHHGDEGERGDDGVSRDVEAGLADLLQEPVAADGLPRTFGEVRHVERG